MRYILSIVTLMVALCVPNPAAAQRVGLDYGVWAGGFQALDIKLDIRIDAKTYRATMDARPAGVLGRLLPWAGHYVTEGVVQNDMLVPVRHERVSAWRDDQDHLRIAFKNGAVARVEKIDMHAGKKIVQPRPQPPGMTTGTVDIITAIVGMLRHATKEGNCTFSAIGFDGKRRFKIAFKDMGNDMLPTSKYNIFSNIQARACQLELTPLMGFSGRPRGYYKIQQEARILGQLPRVWLGRMKKNGPYVPARMLVKSEYGAVFIHLENMTQK